MNLNKNGIAEILIFNNNFDVCYFSEIKTSSGCTPQSTQCERRQHKVAAIC
ncbi:hypothetical protein PGB90_006539 [Kerria lacca]